MTLSTWQIEYGGLVMGPGTAYGHVSLAGFRGLPDISISDPPWPRRDGLVASRSFMGGRTMTLTVNLVSNNASTLESAYSALAVAMIPTDDPANLGTLQAVMSPAWARPRLSNCRVSRAPLLLDFMVERGLYVIVAEFQAPDPLIYDSLVQSVSFSGSGGSYSSTLTNAGNWKAWPVLTVAHLGSGTITVDGINYLTWNVDMGSTSPWVFDMANQTVTDANGIDRTSTLSVGAAWPSVKSGSSVWQVIGSAGSSPSVTAVFSSAWAFA